MSSNATGQPTPLRIFEVLNRFRESMALKSAIDLDIFTHIADGAKTAAEIARRASASERGVRILCDYLTVHGFLTKADRSYALTAEASAFLSRRSPAYIGSVVDFLVNPDGIARFQNLAAAVRKGGVADGAGEMKPENENWVQFARSMMPLMRMSAQIMAARLSKPGEPIKVLDIAAGHGIFGISIAEQNPQAQIVGLDWKNVLTVALENAKAFGVESRYSTIPGSAFEVDLGSDYDLVLIPNFLHHFDPATNTDLLKRVRKALKPGGRVAVLDFVPNEDRISPPIAAAFSLVMLANTASGDAYTLREFETMLREAGFVEVRAENLDPSPSLLLVATRD